MSKMMRKIFKILLRYKQHKFSNEFEKLLQKVKIDFNKLIILTFNTRRQTSNKYFFEISQNSMCIEKHFD